MPRPLRVVVAGGIYHVTSRGNRDQPIVLDDADRLAFLARLRKVIARFQWRLHVACLMTNHYHLVVETPLANLSEGMQQLNGRHAQDFNERHGLKGHLFQGRFASRLIEGEDYYESACEYVIQNPVRAGLVERAELWPWTWTAASGSNLLLPDEERRRPPLLDWRRGEACRPVRVHRVRLQRRAVVRPLPRLFVVRDAGRGSGTHSVHPRGPPTPAAR